MQFNSVLFFNFFGIVFTISWLLRNRLNFRHIILFLSSLIFYGAWNPYYLPLILGAIAITWESGRQISKHEKNSTRKKWLLVGVGSSLSVLAIFKYASFSVNSFEILLGWFGFNSDLHFRFLRKIVLPVGISFYVFQTLSYVIDIYRDKLKHESSLLNYALYVSFFPQLVAGPIVRATDFLPQLKRPAILSNEKYVYGVFLIMSGIFKKVVIADFIAINLVDRVFDATAMMSSLEALVGVYAYTLQIYCDFSGYTDIAIGTAALLGFTLTKNFDSPFKAQNLSEFWQRWHISLSTWLRDYLYISMGGSRNNRKWKTYRNLFITMVLGGLWHGAAWNFVFWGFLHGTGLIIVHLLGRKNSHLLKRHFIFKLIGILLTFHFVVFAFVFFRAHSFHQALVVFDKIREMSFTFNNLPFTVMLAIFAGYFFQFLPDFIITKALRVAERVPMAIQVLVIVLFAGFVQKVAVTDAVPFIYFQF